MQQGGYRSRSEDFGTRGSHLRTGASALPPRVIAFDGDDTLWHDETLFTASHAEFRDLLTRHVDIAPAAIDEVLLATEKRNLALYGYGIKGFVL